MFGDNNFCNGISSPATLSSNETSLSDGSLSDAQQDFFAANVVSMDQFRHSMNAAAKAQLEREQAELLKVKREATGQLLDNGLTCTKIVIGAAVAVIACTAAKKYYDEVRFLYRYE